VRHLVLIPAYGVSLWLPPIVKDLFRQNDLVVGFLVAIPQILRGTAAAAGIAFINSVGNLGGFAGPFVFGAVKDRTGSFSSALVGGSVLMLGAGAIALALTVSNRRYGRDSTGVA
jgi:nitrate/nitrite transporter NarK